MYLTDSNIHFIYVKMFYRYLLCYVIFVTILMKRKSDNLNSTFIMPLQKKVKQMFKSDMQNLILPISPWYHIIQQEQ